MNNNTHLKLGRFHDSLYRKVPVAELKSQKEQNDVFDIDCDDEDSDGKNDEYNNSDDNHQYK